MMRLFRISKGNLPIIILIPVGKEVQVGPPILQTFMTRKITLFSFKRINKLLGQLPSNKILMFTMSI
jgi:hypothetical protein